MCCPGGRLCSCPVVEEAKENIGTGAKAAQKMPLGLVRKTLQAAALDCLD